MSFHIPQFFAVQVLLGDLGERHQSKALFKRNLEFASHCLDVVEFNEMEASGWREWGGRKGNGVRKKPHEMSKKEAPSTGFHSLVKLSLLKVLIKPGNFWGGGEKVFRGVGVEVSETS